MDKKCDECGMPINEETECKCQPTKCYHCCKCNENCECGCKMREKNEKE